MVVLILFLVRLIVMMLNCSVIVRLAVNGRRLELVVLICRRLSGLVRSWAVILIFGRCLIRGTLWLVLVTVRLMVR